MQFAELSLDQIIKGESSSIGKQGKNDVTTAGAKSKRDAK